MNPELCSQGTIEVDDRLLKSKIIPEPLAVEQGMSKSRAVSYRKQTDEAKYAKMGKITPSKTQADSESLTSQRSRDISSKTKSSDMYYSGTSNNWNRGERSDQRNTDMRHKADLHRKACASDMNYDNSGRYEHVTRASCAHLSSTKQNFQTQVANRNHSKDQHLEKIGKSESRSLKRPLVQEPPLSSVKNTFSNPTVESKMRCVEKTKRLGGHDTHVKRISETYPNRLGGAQYADLQHT
jgi:hypothetical protein